MLHDINESHSSKLSDLLESGWTHLGEQLSLKPRRSHRDISDQVDAVLLEINYSQNFIGRCWNTGAKAKVLSNILEPFFRYPNADKPGSIIRCCSNDIQSIMA